MSQSKTSQTIQGGCHCGRVRYTINGSPKNAIHCYCIDCQKLTGTGHNAAQAIDRNDFQVTGELKTYAHPTDSGHDMTLHFCPICSTPIYNSSPNWQTFFMVQVGSLDDPSNFKPTMAFYEKRRQPWDPKFDGEVFEGMPIRK